MFGLRLPELLIILVVLVVLFGAKKLPQLGDSLGKGIRAFKKAAEHGLANDEGAATKEQEPAAPLPPADATKKVAPPETDKVHDKVHRG